MDYNKIITRLEVIRQLVVLEDREDIRRQLSKIKQLLPESAGDKQIREVADIILLIENENYGDAIVRIDAFVNIYRSLVVFTDKEVFALKLEIKALEQQVGSLEGEKAEIEKKVHNFELKYNIRTTDLWGIQDDTIL